MYETGVKLKRKQTFTFSLCALLTDSKSKTLIRIQPKKIYFTLLQWRMMEKSKKLVREKEDCCCRLLEGGCGIG